MKKITTTNDGYYVIEENPTEPVLTITELEYEGYEGTVFSEYRVTGWGGSASPTEDEERCINNMSRSIRYVKEHCDNRGNLG